MKINITQNGKTISVESADANASVPDTTTDAGPDLMALQDDAMKPGSDKEAEFDADDPATQTKTEADDTTEEAEKANEAVILAKYLKSASGRNALRKALKSVEDGEDPASATDTPTTPTDAGTEPAADPAPAADDTTTTSSDVGEVTQTDDEIVIDAGNGVQITVTNDEATASDDTPTDSPAADSGECGDAGAGVPGAESSDAPAADPNADQSLESFFANLNLNDL